MYVYKHGFDPLLFLFVPLTVPLTVLTLSPHPTPFSGSLLLMNPDQPQLSQPVPQSKDVDVTVSLPMLEMACSSTLQYVYDPDVTMTEQDPYSSPFLDATAAPESFRFEEALFTELCFLPANFVRCGYQDSQGQLQSSATALCFRNNLMSSTDVGQSFQLPNGGSSYFSSSLGADKEPTMSFQKYSSSSLVSATGLSSPMTQPPQVSLLASSIPSVSPEMTMVPDPILRSSSRAAQKQLRIFPPASSSTLSLHLASPLPSPQQFSPQPLPQFQSRQESSFYSVLAAHGYIQSTDFCTDQQGNESVSSCLSSMLDRRTGHEMLSPVSDQGLFEVTSEETSGPSESRSIGSSPVLQLNSFPNFPGHQEPLLSYGQVVPSTTSSSPVSPSHSSPRISTFAVIGRNLGGYPKPMAISRSSHRKAMAPVDQVQSSSWTSTSSSVSSFTASSNSSSSSTVPVLPSPLKRHFKSSDSDSDSDELKGIDDDDEEGEAMRITANLSKRRRNRKPVAKNKSKNKAPVIKLTVTCCLLLFVLCIY